ncbi:MAG TPA: MBOAT family O-acyltransferase [Bacteroidales bacterium]|nr:MBOAT family O-acyltransferase [Bacteroidales bacterium]
MLFNSIDFAVFLPIVFVLYWFVTQGRLRLQNLLIVAASYLFYGWWDWRFLSLILFSTLVDYTVGLALKDVENQRKRKLWLLASIFVNLGLLGFFKYYNFFAENFAAAFSFFGSPIKTGSLHIILPVGISFYTFQTMSYTIDVYRRKLEPTRDFIAFTAYVSFFPQLVAGPIERAANLLPQFYRKREFSYAIAAEGMRQILWGLFKKVVIADNAADFANLIFNHSDQYPGSVLFLGGVFFAFQIYCDFSGYSDIAIGTARLFGFELMRNFAFPYFSRDIAEFWRRWHISLSTWFRDYVYIPLGGSHGSAWIRIRNTFIIFVVSGFWHGANWTFVAWGALNALYFLPLLLTRRNRMHLDIIGHGRVLPPLKETLKMLLTFTLTVIAWIFFRAENMGHAISILREIGSASLFTLPGGHHFAGTSLDPGVMFLLLGLFILAEWLGRSRPFALSHFAAHRWWGFRWFAYMMIIVLIGLFAQTTESPFIYFQF